MSPEPDTTIGELDRTCSECDTDFTVESATSRRKYCSPTCRERGTAHLPKLRNCPQCCKEFTTDLSRKRKFCSRECRSASRSSEANMEIRTCPVCDNPFQAGKTVRTIYCSTVCRREAEHRRDQALEEERARRLGQARPSAPPARIELPPPPVARATSRQQAPVRDPLEPTATRDCPHCQQPITIVALLATPEAARPVIGRPPGVPPLRRVP